MKTNRGKDFNFICLYGLFKELIRILISLPKEVSVQEQAFS